MHGGLESSPSLALLLLLNGLSIAGCWWLLLRLRQLDDAVRQRVFVRQLRSLLVSGCAQHAFFVPLLVLDFSSTPDVLTAKQQNRMCFLSYLGFRHFRMVTVLQECHIALTFLVQALRLNKLAPLLTRSIPLVWLSGLVLGVVDDYQSRFFFSSDVRICEMEEPDQISMVLIATSFVCALMSYVISCCTAWCVGSPHSVVRRNFSRAAAYPLNFIVCYGLVLFAHMNLGQAVSEDRQFLVVACALESCSGMLNASVYWWQSRKAVATAQRVASTSASRSPLAETDNSACADDGISFHVAIGGVDVVEIQPVEHEARRRAELQIAAISRSRAASRPRDIPENTFANRALWR